MKIERALKIGALAGVLSALSTPAAAIVYSSSNEFEGNRVITFDVEKPSGQLVEIGPFDTQGTGTGTPIGNQAAMATDASDRDYVFITEANGGVRGVTASYRVDRPTGAVSSLVDLIDQGDVTRRPGHPLAPNRSDQADLSRTSAG